LFIDLDGQNPRKAEMNGVVAIGISGPVQQRAVRWPGLLHGRLPV